MPIIRTALTLIVTLLSSFAMSSAVADTNMDASEFSVLKDLNQDYLNSYSRGDVARFE